MIALAFRPNRIKNRDLWDIAWLKQQGMELPIALVSPKIADHRRSVEEFTTMLQARVASLKDDPAVRTAFTAEMRRFLPSRVVAETVGKEAYWTYLVELVQGEAVRTMGAAAGERAPVHEKAPQDHAEGSRILG